MQYSFNWPQRGSLIKVQNVTTFNVCNSDTFDQTCEELGTHSPLVCSVILPIIQTFLHLNMVLIFMYATISVRCLQLDFCFLLFLVPTYSVRPSSTFTLVSNICSK